MKAKLEKVGDNKFILEVTGYTCPFPTLYTLKALEQIGKDGLLEIITDNQPSCKTIPEAVEGRGHKVLSVEQIEGTLWKIVVRK